MKRTLLLVSALALTTGTALADSNLKSGLGGALGAAANGVAKCCATGTT